MSPHTQAEADMRQKAELIQQIKAMESVPIIRAKFVDTTETGGQGLLAEMSLAEVRQSVWPLYMHIMCMCCGVSGPCALPSCL